MREQEKSVPNEDSSTLSAGDIMELVSKVIHTYDRYGDFSVCKVHQAHNTGLEEAIKIYSTRPSALLVEIKPASGSSRRPVVRVFHPHGRKALPRYLSRLLEQLTGESFDIQKPADTGTGEVGSLRATLSRVLQW